MSISDNVISGRRTSDLLIIRETEYDVDNNIIYDGRALRGTALSQAGWVIEKSTYTGLNLTRVRVSKIGVKWTERATTVTYS